MRYDRVYWWHGGMEKGEWRETTPLANEKASDMVSRIRRKGYVAVRGSSAIGAPVGPPSVDAFLGVGFINRAQAEAISLRLENQALASGIQVIEFKAGA